MHSSSSTQTALQWTGTALRALLSTPQELTAQLAGWWKLTCDGCNAAATAPSHGPFAGPPLQGSACSPPQPTMKRPWHLADQLVSNEEALAGQQCFSNSSSTSVTVSVHSKLRRESTGKVSSLLVCQSKDSLAPRGQGFHTLVPSIQCRYTRGVVFPFLL